MHRFRIALAQLDSCLFDKESNLIKAEEYIRRSAGQGAAAIIFPELYLTGYNLMERTIACAEFLQGSSVKRVAALASRYQIAVIMGYAELSPDGQKAYDAAFVIDAHGQLRASYRKIHLYQAEKDWFTPGDEFCVLDFGLGPTGILICYDLEFPEAARELTLRGAQWIAVCTGNMLPNQHLQEVYTQARAAENRAWVAVANRVGQEREIVFFGESAIADPWGKLILKAGNEEALLIAEIDLDRADQARLNADYLADRRPQLYHKWTTK